MATNKSISFDDDIVFELQHLARDKYKGNLSEAVNEIIKKSLNNSEVDNAGINENNIKILLLNNKILLLQQLNQQLLSSEFDIKFREAEKIKIQQDEMLKTQQNEFIRVKNHFESLGILHEVEKTSIDKWLQLVESCIKKGIKIDGKDIFFYKNTQKLMENDGKNR